MNKLKLTLFANDKFVSKCWDNVSIVADAHPWIDQVRGLEKMVEQLGYQGSYGEDTSKPRILAISIGEDNEYTDVATLFVTSHFENLPDEVKSGAEIIDEREFDYEVCANLFSAKLSNSREISIISYTSTTPFAVFDF